ncbi:DUF3265 domain-containing protein [Vibrio parahaemolyticus]|nr:DUF3265 domain-containing protein [Vibrio parahaemolyticus]
METLWVFCVHVKHFLRNNCLSGGGVHTFQKLTICLRVIRNAWHFYNALVLVIKEVCGDISIALLTP